MKHRALRTALFCSVVLAGCARETAEKAEKKPDDMTTAEVMALVAKATYQPPADGQLTEKQLRMYLDVKRRARKIRAEVPAAPGSPNAQEPASLADLRATLELGYNPRELSWVQERMMEAWIALRSQELDRKITESRNQMLRDLEAQLRSATDPRQKAEIQKQIAEIRAAAPLTGEAPPALGHNAALVRRHEAEVAQAFAEERGPREGRNAP